MFCVSQSGRFWVPLSAVFLHHPPELLHAQTPVLVLVELDEHRLDLLSRQLLGYLQGKLDFYSGNKPYYKDLYFAGQFLAAGFQTLKQFVTIERPDKRHRADSPEDMLFLPTVLAYLSVWRIEAATHYTVQLTKQIKTSFR